MTEFDRHMDDAGGVLATVFGSGQPVFLAFSGGKDSLAVLKLCEPYKGRFKLLWTNTGYTFPHMEKMIRAFGEEYGLVELHSDPKHAWEAGGLPSEVLTVSSFMKRGNGERLQPWNMCCYATKMIPLVRFCAGFDGLITILSGDRGQDGWRFQGAALPENTAFVAPIRAWSDEEVFAWLDAEGVVLPSHYSEVGDSLDCWNCPASWTGGEFGSVAYSRWMRATYPDLAAEALPIARKVAAQVEKTTASMREALSC